MTAGVQRPGRVPKGGRSEIRFALCPNGRPSDAPGLVKALAENADAQFTLGCRIFPNAGLVQMTGSRHWAVLSNTVARCGKISVTMFRLSARSKQATENITAWIVVGNGSLQFKEELPCIPLGTVPT